MAELTAEQVAQRALDLNLLDERQLQQVWGAFGRRDVPTDDFVQTLVRRELVTNYQVERLLKGERAGFFYGDYKVLYLVAAGSFARVYRAVHKDTGKVVALKVLRRRFADNAKDTDQFEREGQVGVELRHPNIVPIYEVASQNRTHYLVMEFVEGGNLRDLMKIRGKLEPTEATELMIDIVSGLHYAFGRGVCHRDLKLTNILVSSTGNAKLVDFGLAAAGEGMSEEALANHPNPRTIDYAGLERATGVRKDDERSDVYFLGCIYYHMLTGKPPLHETRDRVQRLSRQRYVDVPPPQRIDPDLPRSVCAIVNKAMQLDPEQRYQSPGQMLADLKLTAKKLSEGADLPEAASDGDGGRTGGSVLTAALVGEGDQYVLMFVESNVKMQDIFRDGLKRRGYRVLLTSDPSRAMSRFNGGEKGADCVIFSTTELGQSALAAFNEFGTNETTRDIPAVLLLGTKHGAWKSKAELAEHRVALSMPVKLRDLRRVLGKLVAADDGAEEGASA